MEANDLGGRRRLRSEGGHDLGRHAALLSRGGASARRGRAVPELRGAGEALLADTRRARAAHRHRLEHEPRLSAGGRVERAPLPADRDARHRSRLDDEDRRGQRRSGRRARRSQKTARWRSAAATAATPRSFRFTFSSAKAWSRGATTARCASTATSASMATPARSEVEVVRAVLDGRADAGAIGSPFWAGGAQRAPGAGGRAGRDLDVAALQSLHVHGAARSRPGTGAAVRRGPVSEMSYDNPEPPCRARRRRAPALGGAAPRWL